MSQLLSSLIFTNKSSIIGIDISWSSPNSNSIVVPQQRSHMDQKEVCIYFPQYREMVYTLLTEDTMNFTVRDFVVLTLREKNITSRDNVEPESERIVAREFSLKGKEIKLDDLVRWRRMLVVVFLRYVQMNDNESTIFIQTGKTPKQTYQIKYEQYKKMRVRQLFFYHDLNIYRYTALNIEGTIIKGHNTLQGFEMYQGMINACPLISFQTFYHQMHNIYNKLKESDFDFEELVNVLIKGDMDLKKMIDDRYEFFNSSYLDKLTQYYIFYLTSSYYRPGEQRKLLQDYSNGKISDPLGCPQILLIAYMVSRIEQLNNTGNSPKIYHFQKIDEEENRNHFSTEQVIRFEAFVPAFADKPKDIDNKGFDIYEIDHLTANYMGIYNYNDYNYIILPYTEYYVEDIKQVKGNKEIQLVEMSYPKRLNTNLIIWVDDNIKQSQVFRNKHLLPKNYKIEIVTIKSNKMYEFWLRKYYNMLAFRKVKIITNMRRGMEEFAGVETIQLTRRYLHSDVSIMMYVRKVDECIKVLKERVQYFQEILVSDRENVLKEFILYQEGIEAQKEEKIDKCYGCSIKQTEKCQIF